MSLRYSVVLLVILLAGCAGAPPVAAPTPVDDCAPDATAAYAIAIGEIIQTYQQQAILTASTPRASIGTPLQRLLDVQTEARRLTPPPCVAAYHARVLDAMQAQQDGFQRFAAGGDAGASIEAGARALADAAGGLGIVSQGEIPPTSTPLPPPPTVVPTATRVPVPTPGPVAISPPRIMVLDIAAFMHDAPDGERSKLRVCAGATLEASAQQAARGGVWYAVRVIEPGTCPDAAPAEAEGWIKS